MTMSAASPMKKTLELKWRPQGPNLDLPNQSHAAKVFIPEALLNRAGISYGDGGVLCSVEPVPEPDKEELEAVGGRLVEAVVVPALDKNAPKNAALLSRALQHSARLPLTSSIRVTELGPVPTATQVMVEDVTLDVPPLNDAEVKHWEWLIEGRLVGTKLVFAGVQTERLLAVGPKRSFQVKYVDGRTGNVARFGDSTRVQIVPRDHVPSIGAPCKLELAGVPGLHAQVTALNGFLANYGVDVGTSKAPKSCGMVIQGSPGTGKSMLLDRLAATASVTAWGKVVRVDLSDKPSVLHGYFNAALVEQRPTLILIDNIKSITGKDKPNREAAIDAIEQGLSALAAKARELRKRPDVIVIATCDSYLDDVPWPLRKGTCFRKHIDLPIPDVPARREILCSVNLNFRPEDAEQHITRLAESTHAYTAGDLMSLAAEAEDSMTLRLGSDSGYSGPMMWEDVSKALEQVKPTAMHDISLKPPTVHYHDIGGNDEVKMTLRKVFEKSSSTRKSRFKKPAPPKGILLYGPPGCSKTLTAQAVATESGFNFFSVKGGELLNMYVGETERAIRRLFQRARDASPSIIFFDEIDSIVGSSQGGGGGGVGRGGGVQALQALLTEMDGFEQLGHVFVLGATNKPEYLDPSLIRPGRFDRLIYVPLPDERTREAIFGRKAKEWGIACSGSYDHDSSSEAVHVDPPLDVSELAKRTAGHSGAEISQIWNRAFDDDDVQDVMAALTAAMGKVTKAVTPNMLIQYDRFRKSVMGWEA